MKEQNGTTTTNGTTLPIKKDSFLTRLTPDEVSMEIKDPVDPIALQQVKEIFNELLSSSSPSDSKSDSSSNTNRVVTKSKLLAVAKRLGDISNDDNDKDSSLTYTISKEECKNAFDNLDSIQRNALINICERIRTFANVQRQSITDISTPIPGGIIGHTVSPCTVAGCYAPGGRYPLPSSVLMTAVTARAAGCSQVILASPKPAQITLAAAHIANVDLFLCVGGAQAIASMAYGVINDDDNNITDTKTKKLSLAVPRCDVICGPGNKWVTAAKSIVNGQCGIDMLAGPSEVLVICNEYANADIVAADLIAQAEHDVVARAIVLCTDETMITNIDTCVYEQVQVLPEPNRSTAVAALQNNSFIVLCTTIDECISISDSIAPEHLEIHTGITSEEIGKKCINYGGLFIGQHAAEVLGDYGAGPNHTLPTGGTGRYTGGLSVFNFLRIRTFMNITNNIQSQPIVNDSIIMARCEGLEGHARAAEKRLL